VIFENPSFPKRPFQGEVTAKLSSHVVSSRNVKNGRPHPFFVFRGVVRHSDNLCNKEAVRGKGTRLAPFVDPMAKGSVQGSISVHVSSSLERTKMKIKITGA